MQICSAYSQKSRLITPIIGESMTKQNHKNECDINFIMSKHAKTGLVTHVANKAPQYGEYETIDYKEAMNLVISAQESFDSLPANLRKRFGNDPNEYFQFVHDPENRDEMIKMGLIQPSEAPNVQEPIPDPDDKKSVKKGDSVE